MSKITFRADDELVAQLEEFEASKSAIMREALRTYLNTHMGRPEPSEPELAVEQEHWMDHVIRERVEQLLGEEDSAFTQPEPQDINVNISVEGEPQTAITEESQHAPDQCKTRTTTENAGANQIQCDQCGEIHSKSHAYCPSCGEQSTQPDSCECGADVETNWSFCPDCGRRSPSEPALDRS